MIKITEFKKVLVAQQLQTLLPESRVSGFESRLIIFFPYSHSKFFIIFSDQIILSWNIFSIYFLDVNVWVIGILYLCFFNETIGCMFRVSPWHYQQHLKPPITEIITPSTHYCRFSQKVPPHRALFCWGEIYNIATNFEPMKDLQAALIRIRFSKIINHLVRPIINFHQITHLKITAYLREYIISIRCDRSNSSNALTTVEFTRCFSCRNCTLFQNIAKALKKS